MDSEGSTRHDRRLYEATTQVHAEGAPRCCYAVSSGMSAVQGQDEACCVLPFIPEAY
jgi:hypothetical protein